tara:strand:+ start:2349 stop:2786 length:438 start_codon:yes stop_codon:yes gene_type:complete
MSIEETRKQNLEKMMKVAGLTREERDRMYQQTEKDFRRRFADYSRYESVSADSNIRLVENLRTFSNSLRALMSTSNDYSYDILNIVMMYALNGFNIDTRLHYLLCEEYVLSELKKVDQEAWEVQYGTMCEGLKGLDYMPNTKASE